MKAEIIEKIEQYLNDEMPPQQRKDFEGQLSTDNELSNEFELYNSINKTMSASPNENELRRTLQQMNQKYFAAGGRVKQGSFKKWLAVAASLIFIIALSFYFILQSKPSAEKLYAQFAQHQNLNIQLRGSAADSLAQKAATDFNNKNYSSALLLLEAYLQQQPGDVQMKFSLGICYLETGKYDEAGKIFSAISGGQTAFAESAEWYMALTALKQEDFTKCRSNLSSIPNTSVYFTKAKALLEKLPD
jgi:predicted Zn-dependent protease